MDLHVCSIYVIYIYKHCLCVAAYAAKLEAYFCNTSKCFVFIPQFLSEPLMMLRGTLDGIHWSTSGLISLRAAYTAVPVLLFLLPDQLLCIVKSISINTLT